VLGQVNQQLIRRAKKGSSRWLIGSPVILERKYFPTAQLTRLILASLFCRLLEQEELQKKQQLPNLWQG